MSTYLLFFRPYGWKCTLMNRYFLSVGMETYKHIFAIHNGAFRSHGR